MDFLSLVSSHKCDRIRFSTSDVISVTVDIDRPWALRASSESLTLNASGEEWHSWDLRGINSMGSEVMVQEWHSWDLRGIWTPASVGLVPLPGESLAT